MTLLEWALLGGASALAGALNAVAGGGSFLTLPALAMVGVPQNKLSIAMAPNGSLY